VTSRPAAAQHLRDLARLRRVRDRIDREYAQPLDVEALARGAHMSAGGRAALSHPAIAAMTCTAGTVRQPAHDDGGGRLVDREGAPAQQMQTR